MITKLDTEDIQKFTELTSNRILELIILPTENCNFRCVYCYEDFSIGKMKSETIDGIKNLITFRAPKLDLIYIQWFGGEPLVASDIMLDISAHIQNLCKEYPNLKYRSSATTNGYLLNKSMFNKLIHAGVTDYQISLDGPKEIHDLTRITAGKKGTFDKIWNNLLDMRDSEEQFSVLLRVHFKKDTVEAVKILIQDIQQTFGGDSRFHVFFKAISHLGGPNDNEIEIVKGNEQKRVLDELKALLHNGNYKDASELTNNICYAARANSLIVRANGRLSKCTVALYDDRNSVGFINQDGTLSIKQEHMNLWLRGIKELDSTILACPLQNLPKITK